MRGRDKEISEEDIIRLSPSELDVLVDREARTKVGISGKEFIRRLEAGKVSSESPMERSVAFLARYLKQSKESRKGCPRVSWAN